MDTQFLLWQDNGLSQKTLWWSERASKAPSKVVLADDTMNADKAYKLACEGTGLLWRGDFQNAKQLLQALARRIDKAKVNKKGGAEAEPQEPVQLFHRHRQAQAQRANVLHKVLIQIQPDRSIALRRAPDVSAAIERFIDLDAGTSGKGLALSLRDLLGLIGAYEWFKKGVEVPALGKANNRVHAEYGVYSPVRGEYLDLIAQATMPKVKSPMKAFDIGTGTGVVAALLAKRGVDRVVATDINPRALRCAKANFERLGLLEHIDLLECDLFPEGEASLIVCNPPWLPAKATSSIEHTVYDPDSQMLKGFLKGLSAHLQPQGEGWLVLSDLAEHLGLRAPTWLENEIHKNHLKIRGVTQCRPHHPKTKDLNDPLALARSKEVTSLWRLGHA